MKIKANGKDITRLIEKITWSGDRNQVARKFNFTYVYPRNKIGIEKINIDVGDRITFNESGKLRFDGVVIKQSRAESGITISIDAVDYAWYTSKIKVYGTYTGTPQAITTQICSEYGIAAGHITGSSFETQIISTGDKSIYQVITTAYKDVHYNTAYINMTGKTLNVDAMGKDVIKTITGNNSAIDANYTSSIENMVNKVIIIDKDSNYIGETSTADLKYGLMQECYKAQEDEDYYAEAGKLFKSIENTGNITCTGDYDCVTGKAVYIKKVSSNITGKFTIIADSHSISDAEHTMTLSLGFNEVV